MITKNILAASSIALLGACRNSTSAVPTTGEIATAPSTTVVSTLKEGAMAPSFSRTSHDGVVVGTAESKGKYLVVYFYPKSESPGCTKEACSFRDTWNDLSKQNVVLVGVSGDDDIAQRGFADHYKLPFHLIPDVDGSLARTFGVPFNHGSSARQTIVIGPDGAIKKIFRSVDVTTHAAEIAATTK